MKRNVMAVAAAVLAAGVASAFALAPSSQPAHVAPPAPAAEAKPATAAAPVVAGGKPTFEARQAPVPILLKPRPTIESPAVAAAQPETPKAGDKAADPATSAPATSDQATSDPASGAAAKAAVEADGYKGVKVLRKGDNGLWYAEGLRGSTKVLLMVDAQGNVTSQ